jgi:hypothetical protein
MDLITPRGPETETLKAQRKEESERERKRDLTEKRRERKLLPPSVTRKNCTELW